MPPSPTLGVTPASLHSGGPPSAFVFGEPKVKAPAIDEPTPLGQNWKGKEKEGGKRARGRDWEGGCYGWEDVVVGEGVE